MFKHRLWLDTETRSEVDLKKHGQYRYREGKKFRVLIAGYGLDNGPIKSVILNADGGLPIELSNMLRDRQVQVCAHGSFDRVILGKHAPPPERWYCTMTQARAIGLPPALENLGRAVGANLRKDVRGKELIKLLSIPQPDGSFINDPALMQEFAAYCTQDVEVMRAMSLAMPPLDAEAQAVWQASERINDTGLPIDLELCQLATQYADVEAIEAQAAIVEITRGALTKVKGTGLRDWVYARLDPAARKHMELYKNGKKTTSLAVDVRATLLELAAEEPDLFDPDVVEVIEAAEAGAMSSVAKFQAMLERCSADGRLRGAFITNGALQTNRWSATGAQVHNFPRVTHPDPEAALRVMRKGLPLERVLATLKSLLRPAICPGKGRVVVRADWSAVEARGLPWLAQHGSAEYLAAFTVKGRDIYVEQAKLAGVGERQAGKVVVLSLGYGGAVGALSKMAKNYGVKIAAPERVVSLWRRANQWASHPRIGWWASLMRCAFSAMKDPGQTFKAGRMSLRMEGANLVQVLPSGRRLHYPMAEIRDQEVHYLKGSWKPKADAKEWPRGRLWHGILAENATQAACADLLRSAIVKGVASGLPIIGHVHDEVICEVDARDAKTTAQALQRAMLDAPAWARGLPLAVETEIAPRFRK